MKRYQVRRTGRHNNAYIICYDEHKGETTADGKELSDQAFDKVLFEGEYKEAVKYYLENVVLNSEPL